MSWQSYIDDHLMCDVEGNQLTSDAIIGQDGSIWAQSAKFPQLKPEEITGINKDFEEAGFLAPTGLFLGGVKYMVVQGEQGAVIRGKKGRTGRAFLFSHAMNIVVGAKEDRHLLTGLHTVADISCADCNEPLGWKYERAYETSQKYKEGKFIFEKAKIVKEDW